MDMDLTLSDKEKRLLQRDDRLTGLFGLGIQGCGLLVLLSAAIVGWQAIEWLQRGEWPTLSIEMSLSAIGIERLAASWVGVQRIVDWILTQPLSGALFFTAIGALWLLLAVCDRPDSEALRIARMKQARRRAGYDG